MIITAKEMETICNDRLGFQIFNSFSSSECGDTFGFVFNNDEEAEEYIESLVCSVNNLLYKMKGEFNQ